MSYYDKFKEMTRKLEFGRIKFRNDIIENIGQVVEDDHSITCIVQQNKLDRSAINSFYDLHLFGINNNDDEIKQIVNHYHLDKPVHYIFDGIFFDKPINIFSAFCDITFRNCTFSNSPIYIVTANKVSFENNMYFYTGSKSFLKTTATIGEINFNNESFINMITEGALKINFGMDITAGEVNIIDSFITTNQKDGSTYIKAKQTNMYKSTINSPEIYLDSDGIFFGRSLFQASNGIIIENKDCACDTEVGFYRTISPFIIYNGREIYLDNDPNLEIHQKRVTQVLQNLKMKCDEFTEEKLRKVQNSIESQPVKTIVKKI